MDFAKRYGPWAVISGASEGTGRSFARKIAAKGLRCLLIARREAPLKALAEEIRAESGTECVTASIDLAAPDAFDRIVAAVGDREVGLLVKNAGADPNASRFLDRDIGTWLSLVHMNVITAMQCCHHFGGLMKQRGRGGLLLVNSGAAFGAGNRLATYSASKAFLLNFGEGLWSELKPHGVDVLNLLMSTTDTPALRTLLTAKGRPLPSTVASSDAVADLGLAKLGDGPNIAWGEQHNADLYGANASHVRRARVLRINESSKAVLGDG